MHSMGNTIAELHAMLKLHEKSIPKKAKTPAVLAKKKPKGAKGKDKGKKKLAYAPKPKLPPSPKRDNPAKDSVCHHCKEVSHWRRNYPSYQAELKKRKNDSVASTLFAGNSIQQDSEVVYVFIIPGSFTSISFTVITTSLPSLRAFLPQADILLKMDVVAQNTNNSTISYVDAYEAQFDAQNEVACLMLGSMYLDLQRALENYKAYDMIQELKTMFEEQAKQELFKTGKIQKDKTKPQGAKGKDKGKTKIAYAPTPKIPLSPKRDNPVKDSVCHHCQDGLRESRKLKHKVLSLYVGNGIRAAVEAIKSFDLVLPSGLIIVLHNCHFTPTITRGVVSITRLVDNGYIRTFTNYGISVLKNNVFYFNAIPRDGIYETNMHNIYPNVSSIYNVSNKRAKHTLDSTWYCRLGHINKKHIEKLQRDGILQPTHDESLEKCKSCISRKMARKPFPHQVERAKDLLGLIHTHVCDCHTP
ncbi:retrotransposon protein, putative, ty1-copia subclass [Tanacetum coccineum]